MQIEPKHPMHIMPTTRECKTFTETGHFQDGLQSDPGRNDADAAMAAARLHRDAVRLAKLDNGPQDKDPAPGKVWTETKMCDFTGDASYPSSLTYCDMRGDSTTYGTVNHLQNPNRELVAFGVQSNLEFGGPPTELVGFCINTDDKSYYSERKTL